MGARRVSTNARRGRRARTMIHKHRALANLPLLGNGVVRVWLMWGAIPFESIRTESGPTLGRQRKWPVPPAGGTRRVGSEIGRARATESKQGNPDGLGVVVARLFLLYKRGSSICLIGLVTLPARGAYAPRIRPSVHTLPLVVYFYCTHGFQGCRTKQHRPLLVPPPIHTCATPWGPGNRFASIRFGRTHDTTLHT